MRRRAIQQERGVVVLAATYWVLILFLLIGATSTLRSFQEVQAATRFVSSMQALHIAEAGADSALQTLIGAPAFQGTDGAGNGNGAPNPAAPGGPEWQALPNGGFFWSSVVADGPNRLQINTIGVAGGVSRRLQLVLNRGGANLPSGAILSEEKVHGIGEPGAGDHIRIEGNILTNYRGAYTVFLEDTLVDPATDPLTGLPIPNTGSIIMMGLPPMTTPTLYVDPGRSIPSRRDPSSVAGAIDLTYALNVGITPNPTTLIAETEGVARHVGLVSRGGWSGNSPPNGQPTRVAGGIAVTSQPLTLPPVIIPPTSPITVNGKTFANDCGHDFEFHENNNSLTELGGDLRDWAGPGIANRKLPGGTPGNPKVYCFQSFKAVGNGAADVPQVLFDGPVIVYIDSSGAGTDVEIGRPAQGLEQEWNARINWQVDAGGGAMTRPPEDFWLMVKGATRVNEFNSHVAGSIYAPESWVTITGSTGPDHLTGMLVGERVFLWNQVKIRNLLPVGTTIPGLNGGVPGVLSWEECAPLSVPIALPLTCD